MSNYSNTAFNPCAVNQSRARACTEYWDLSILH